MHRFRFAPLPRASMSVYELDLAGPGPAGSWLWGAAHALDLGAVLLDEVEWGGLEADAVALGGDWQCAIAQANREIHVREAGEAE
jgi:hypothetical protein